jgi:hypothetical protein
MKRFSIRETLLCGFLILPLLASCATEPDPVSTARDSSITPSTAPPETSIPSPESTLVPSPSQQISDLPPVPLPTSTNTQSTSLETSGEYVWEDRGFSIRLPDDGWEPVQRSGATFILRTEDKELFPEQTPDVGAIVLSAWLLDQWVEVELLESPAELLEDWDAVRSLVEKIDLDTETGMITEIGGYPAYSVTGRTSAGDFRYLAVILAADLGRGGIFYGFSSPDLWVEAQQNFQVIASSINLFEPEIDRIGEPSLDLGMEDLNLVPFVSQAGGFQIEYPENWFVLDDVVYDGGRMPWHHTTIALNEAHSKCEQVDTCQSPVVVHLVSFSKKDFDSFVGNCCAEASILEDYPESVRAHVAEVQFDIFYTLVTIFGQTGDPEATQIIDVNGRSAIGARFTGEDYYSGDDVAPIRGYTILVAGETRVVLILAHTPFAVWPQFWPIFTVMLDSFSFVR